MGCLRNALANGGVVYLDRRGRRSQDSMNMLTFAPRPAAWWQDELRLLGVSADGFEDFLAHWSRWLAASGIEAALDDRSPGWLDAVT